MTPVLRCRAMRPWRIWLLLCLMLLVPFRGAVASAMLCPPAGTGHHAVPASEHKHHGHHGAATDVTGQADDEHSDDRDDSDHGDRCRLCAAFCSVASIVHTAPAALPLQGPMTTVFPEAGPSAPSFLADGQERPPRSI